MLVGVIEKSTGDTSRDPRHELDRMHPVTLATADGRVAQRSPTTTGQKSIATVSSCPSPRFFDVTAPSATPSPDCLSAATHACSNTTPSRQ
jgi:hypothetical protein